jgi:hypothetical protein
MTNFIFFVSSSVKWTLEFGLVFLSTVSVGGLSVVVGGGGDGDLSVVGGAGGGDGGLSVVGASGGDGGLSIVRAGVGAETDGPSSTKNDSYVRLLSEYFLPMIRTIENNAKNNKIILVLLFIYIIIIIYILLLRLSQYDPYRLIY